MFGSIALDIALGLVFIFLLYSLLASIIGELIAVFLGLRARNLAQAICRMLENEKVDANPSLRTTKVSFFIIDIWNDLRIFLTGKWGGEAFKGFYSHPMVKYMTNGKFYSKPSYLSEDIFSKVILDMLCGNSIDLDGSEDIEKVKKSLKGDISDNKKLLAIDNLLQLKDQEISSDSIRSIITGEEENGLFKGETRLLLASLLKDAQFDLVKFKYLLEKWFNQTMERTSGWYKRINQSIIFFIGFTLAAVFNASTLKIVDILSQDKNAREGLVALATSYNSGIVEKEHEATLDTLLSIKTKLDQDIDKANSILGIGWSVPDSLDILKKKKIISDPEIQHLVYLKKSNDFFLYAQIPISLSTHSARKGIFVKGENKDHKEIWLIETNKLETRVKIRRGVYRWSEFWANISGYLITALAISLGAPFWFDLLNKIIRIRTSVKPESQTNDTGIITITSDKREG